MLDDQHAIIIDNKKKRLFSLKETLNNAKSVYEKIEILDSLPEVDVFFSNSSVIKSFLSGLSPECEYVFKVIFAIGQGQHIFKKFDQEDIISKLRIFLEDLLSIETFYLNIGGIIGYQYQVLSLLQNDKKDFIRGKFLKPNYISLMEKNNKVNAAILSGIKMQGELAEFYPVGGAADRLQLKDETTNEVLPAARLVFLGKSLLKGIIHDLQSREYLHYKVFDKQTITPIVMMTSNIHCNDERIREICKNNRWFNRRKDTFSFIKQPSVPVFNRQGDWCLEKPIKLLLKPGGHGMLWTLLENKGIFKDLKEKGCKKALVRQINNPMVGTDYGLLAFLGFGYKNNSTFGFASCSRLINSHEGMNVIRSEESGDQFLTNIEYCDFKKFGIKDQPYQEGSIYSKFPSNTNILFADLKQIQSAVKKHPLPGLIANFRESFHYHSNGKKEELARLETMAQNIADVIDANESYLTFNERRKTISTTKYGSKKGSMIETPFSCYYDYMLNIQELLENHCNFNLPNIPNKKEFIEKGPPFLFTFHPALGPLYSIIGQKIQRGQIYDGSELQLEITDLELNDLDLEGSCLIHAEKVLGHTNQEGVLQYSNLTGQCSLKNVRIVNKGVNWKKDWVFWKHDIKRSESFKILLKGHSRFIAENVTFKDDLTIEVPHGMCMIASEKKGQIILHTEPLQEKGPFWNYAITENKSIQLKK